MLGMDFMYDSKGNLKREYINDTSDYDIMQSTFLSVFILLFYIGCMIIPILYWTRYIEDIDSTFVRYLMVSCVSSLIVTLIDRLMGISP